MPPPTIQATAAAAGPPRASWTHPSWEHAPAGQQSATRLPMLLAPGGLSLQGLTKGHQRLDHAVGQQLRGVLLDRGKVGQRHHVVNVLVRVPAARTGARGIDGRVNCRVRGREEAGVGATPGAARCSLCRGKERGPGSRAPGLSVRGAGMTQPGCQAREGPHRNSCTHTRTGRTSRLNPTTAPVLLHFTTTRQGAWKHRLPTTTAESTLQLKYTEK